MKISPRSVMIPTPYPTSERRHRPYFGSRGLPDVWVQARVHAAVRPFDDTQTIGHVFDRAIAKCSGKVWRDKKILRGVPCLRRTRIPLYQICGMVAEGMKYQEVAQSLGISEEQVKTALRFASIILEQ